MKKQITEGRITLKMNRPMTKNDTGIFPGTICLVDTDHRKYEIDFEMVAGSIDKKDPSKVHYELGTPNFEAFPDMNNVTEYLAEITHVEECLITDYSEEEDSIKVESVESFALLLKDEQGVNSEHAFSKEVFKNCNLVTE